MRSLWVALLIAAFLPALALVGLRFAPVADAAGSCSTSPCIHWADNMIYPGQNSGNPWGPVGVHASVHGTHFTPGSYTLAVVKGDVLTTPDSPYSFCKLSQKVPVGGDVTVGADGTFDAAFDWPADANSGQWSICAYLSATGFPLLDGNLDDGPFTVLAPTPPSISVSAATVAPGGTLTVTGHNWLPAQGSIFVYLGPCADCDGQPVASTQATSGPDGSFTATLALPASAQGGTNIVSANAHQGLLDIGNAGAKHVNVLVQPSPTASTAPTVTATTAPTVTTTAGSTGGTGSNNNDNTGLLVGLGVAIVLLLAAVAGLVAYLLVRRNSTPGGPGEGFGGPGGPSSQPGGYGTQPGFGNPYGAPQTPTPQRGMWSGDWDPEATSAFPGQGTEQTGATRPASPYADDAPTNPGHQPPEDPWGR